MILIDEVLIEDQITSQCFACNLTACKGACCWEGDFGAPLDPDEVDIIESLLPEVLPMINPEAKSIIETEGHATYYPDMKQKGTPLSQDKFCVYLVKQGDIAMCAFEMLEAKGRSKWKKPMSCHLYPIRIEKNPQTGFSLMRYDHWEICNPAISHGEKSKTKVFEFAREAITRKYGEEFYDRLEMIANK